MHFDVQDWGYTVLEKGGGLAPAWFLAGVPFLMVVYLVLYVFGLVP